MTANPLGPGWATYRSAWATELNRKYAATCGGIDTGDILLFARKGNGYQYRWGHGLEDGYVPFAAFTFSLPPGKVAVVFPHFSFPNLDPTGIEREVMVCTMGKTPDNDVNELLKILTAALPDMKPPPVPPADDFVSQVR